MKTRGFTLLEVLIAIAIFSLLGLASYTSLQQVLQADANSREHSESLAELQWAMGQLQQDFEQLVRRPHRSEIGTEGNWALQAGDGVADSRQSGVYLLRGGWRNPADLLPRSEVQLVSYRVQEDRLIRGYYPYADVVSGSEPREGVLIEGVERFTLLFFDGTEWLNEWRQDNLPKAVRLQLELAQWGQLERWFLIPEGA